MIKILCDTTAYIPTDYAQENDVRIIPLRVLFDDEEFEEGPPGTYDSFFEKFTKSKVFPKTSQPSLQLFIDEFNKVIDEGNEGILFTISNTLSGTVSVAELARKQCKDPDKISVIDSQNCCQTIWGLVMEAKEMADKGLSRQEILDEIAKLQVGSTVAFVPDSLEYLKRGGRIGKVKAIIGSMLNIKPLLVFRQGELTNPKKVIGVNKAVSELIAQIPEKIRKLFIIHIAKSKNFEYLKQKLSGKYDVPTFEGEVGPVVAAHIGPAIGVCWIC